MDFHAESCTICVLDATGRRVRQDVVETNGRALVDYFKQLPGQLHLCFEESEWAPWLWQILSPHVAEPVVFRGERRKGSKSDAIDAHGLAERLRTGQITNPIFKAPKQFAKLRELARVYGLLTLDLARAKNRLKSSFRRRGVRCEGTAVFGAEGRAQRLRQLPAALRGAVELLGVQLDCLEELKSEAESAMVDESHRHRISRILETVPGLGPVRVAQLLPIVVTPHRFRTKRQFWAYCGFGVVTRSSADWVRLDGQWVRARVAQTRGLNFNFNRTLKMIFKGAATTVIAHAGPTPFREAYERLCEQGTKPNLAKVTVARKIAATVLAMWKSEEVYDPKR
jgi:transposase